MCSITLVAEAVRTPRAGGQPLGAKSPGKRGGSGASRKGRGPLHTLDPPTGAKARHPPQRAVQESAYLRGRPPKERRLFQHHTDGSLDECFYLLKEKRESEGEKVERETPSPLPPLPQHTTFWE